jgi:hypothetical protein
MKAKRTSNQFAATMCAIGLLCSLFAGVTSGHGSNNDDDDETDIETTLVLIGATVAAVVGTSPFWGPMAVTGKKNSEPGYFVEYPFKHGGQGNMAIGESLQEDLYAWSVQAKTSFATNFGRYNRIDTGIQLEGIYRLGIDTGFDYWRESVNGAPTRDFWTGDANLMYRFAQSEWLQTRAGVGGAWLEDGANSDYGFNFTYKADLFLGDPFILSAELDWGTLGDETLFHPRATLGAQWHRAELYIGVDYFDIGPRQTTSLLAGGRFWY